MTISCRKVTFEFIFYMLFMTVHTAQFTAYFLVKIWENFVNRYCSLVIMTIFFFRNICLWIFLRWIISLFNHQRTFHWNLYCTVIIFWWHCLQVTNSTVILLLKALLLISDNTITVGMGCACIMVQLWYNLKFVKYFIRKNYKKTNFHWFSQQVGTKIKFD